ncbi:MAG: HlyD family secretion protein [Syntrophorhabdaceae bacterium]|nr:HlyD family secretion protein [Syntrophorhabdaceae bacterium]
MSKKNAILLSLLFLGAVVVFGVAYRSHSRANVSTDDAFIDGRIHMVASQIQGKVVEVPVRDNQMVKPGDPLVHIDPEPFIVREDGAESAVAGSAADLAAARADLLASEADVIAAQKDKEGAEAQLAQVLARIEAARAKTALSSARLSQAQRDAARMKSLWEQEVISRESHEKAQTDADVAMSQEQLDREELRLAEAAVLTQQAMIAQREAILAQRRSVVIQRRARIGQQEAQLKQRKSSLAEAKLLRGYTAVVSPTDGYVTRKNVEVGQVVSPGQQLLAVAALDNVWVVANYKETEIARIRAGQEVIIRVDTFGRKKFRGKVDSIMAGTGSAFALLPPENASGNYVKVVQRVPVKILISPGEDPEHILRIGMSVVPTILTR